MNSYMETLFQWIKRRYSEIGLEISQEKGSSSSCVWSGSGDKADLFDAQIGVWTRFVLLNEVDDVESQVISDVGWAIGQVSKLEVRSGVVARAADEDGQWQVHLVWIVSGKNKEKWESAIREVRRRSSHSEEIGIDLIDASAGDLLSHLESHGIPPLLFRLRELVQLSESQIPEWRSPDSAFEDRVSRYLTSIVDSEQRLFAMDVVARLGVNSLSVPDVMPAPAKKVERLIVKDFRNVVNAELGFDYNGGATVIHGPNGTGKSSLFEALCLGLFGASDRLRSFLDDKDLTARAKAGYVQNVLTRFSAEKGAVATVALDGEESLSAISMSSPDVGERLVRAGGTVLAQESARDFVMMESREVASLVLGDYSPRARALQDGISQGATEARSVWQNWLRDIGLNAAITKQETILRKLVGRVVAEQCPQVSQSVYDWLDALSQRFTEFEAQARQLHQRLEDFDSLGARERLVNDISSAIEKGGIAHEILSTWLHRRASVISEVGSLVDVVENSLADLLMDWPAIEGDIAAWAAWIRRPKDDAVQSAVVQVAETSERETEIRRRLSELAPEGQELRLRKEHLESLVQRVLPVWEKGHELACPSCDAVHVDGIRNVVSGVLTNVSKNYEMVRNEYAALQRELKEFQQAPTLGNAPPISEERMVSLGRMLRFDADGVNSLEAMLRDEDFSWRDMLKLTSKIFAFPRERASVDHDAISSLSSVVVSKVMEMRADGAKKQELPRRWDDLKKNIDQVSLEVVSSHMPRKLGAVWQEIALALAPARWNQVAPTKMVMDINRGTERVGIVLDRGVAEMPVRHILNQAEQHVLGLAWFFTRHLSFGRFVSPLLAMDDPAQEMDQVTYRRFVRFIQAFLRMHRTLRKQISILVFLHQEERALEMSRALSLEAGLTVLEWSKEVRSSGPNATMKQIVLRNSEQRAVKPTAMLDGGDTVLA